MKQNFEPLLAVLRSGGLPVPAPGWKTLAAAVRVRQVAPKDVVLRAGEQASLVFFVRSGLLREFYVDEAGHETTRTFCPENDFSGSLADLRLQQPSMVSIDALEVSELWQFPFAVIDALADEHHGWAKVMRQFAEGLFIRKMRREFEMMTLSATERYARFRAAHAPLDARLPRHLVASYLGITPVHFSRIRGRKK